MLVGLLEKNVPLLESSPIEAHPAPPGIIWIQFE
jgi:hypothetical protein